MSVSEIYIEAFKAMVYHAVVNFQVKLSGHRTTRFVTLPSAKGTVTLQKIHGLSSAIPNNGDICPT